MKIYITKYVLTRGILEANGKAVAKRTASVTTATGTHLYHEHEWHRSLAEAQKVARVLLERKRKSLTKSLDKINVYLNSLPPA